MNSLKRMAKAWLLMNGAFVLLVLATQPAMANEGLDLDSILSALPLAGPVASLAFSLCCMRWRSCVPSSLRH